MRHIKTHGETTRKRLFCEVCAVTFFKQTVYIEHMKSHEEDEVTCVKQQDFSA